MAAEQRQKGAKSVSHNINFANVINNLQTYKKIPFISAVIVEKFCQLYKNRTWYYVDARGITNSFDEFMTVAREFVSDEYTIRPATSEDIEEWEKDSRYNEVAYAFAEAVIRKYQRYYTL